MSRRHVEEETLEDITNLESLDAYIEASEMYLEALKLSDGRDCEAQSKIDSGYIIGMTAVYFGKAYLAFTSSDNEQAIKGSLVEAINAYSTALAHCENNNIGKHFIDTAKLIVQSMRIELHNI